MQYTIIEAPYPDILTTKVNEALQQGWVLHGNLSVISLGNRDMLYCQSMTRS